MALAAAWGAVWGSFATVIIRRYPRDESIVSPGSRCPLCRTPIRWYDNIPVLGYVLLRGRCRTCRGRIPPMYPSVEIVCILLALIAWTIRLRPDASIAAVLADFFITFTFFWALFVVSVVDIESFLVPDIITLPCIVLFLSYNLIVARERTLEIALSVAGAYLLVFVFFNLFYRIITGYEGMGMGDAKLLAMIAALTGWKGALLALIAGAVQGLVVNTPLIAYRKWRKAGRGAGNGAAGGRGVGGEGGEPGERAAGSRGERTFLKVQVPFGPMLALGAFEFILWGEEIMDAYIGAADAIALLFS